jgi:hypothetical protein
MHFKLSRIIFVVCCIFPTWVYAQQENNDYYKNLAKDAISSASVYFSLYEKCLKYEKVTGVCDEYGAQQSVNELKRISNLKDRMLQSHAILYSDSQTIEFPDKPNLQLSREKFELETVYLQRKLIIFIAKVEHVCGEQKAYEKIKAAGRATSEYYISDLILSKNGLRNAKLDDPIFEEYEKNLADGFNTDARCKYFLNKNRSIYFNAYSNQFEIIKKTDYPERALIFYLLALIEELKK